MVGSPLVRDKGRAVAGADVALLPPPPKGQDAYYGPLPDDITLTGAEATRAFLERDKFNLAVVAGLEEGYDTVVKIFPNPLRILELKPNTSVTLTGIRRRGKVLTVRLHALADETAALGTAS